MVITHHKQENQLCLLTEIYYSDIHLTRNFLLKRLIQPSLIGEIKLQKNAKFKSFLSAQLLHFLQVYEL
jgi:hypothetical protein